MKSTIYGRFDLAWDGKGPPKLLEYNADTPTALLEAAVIQWFWFKDLHSGHDQFNSIHERLIEAWGRLKQFSNNTASRDLLHVSGRQHGRLYDGHVSGDTAMQAKLQTQHIELEQIGWNRVKQRFVDEAECPIEWIFKLYPWEWMLRESFANHLIQGPARWLEPPWKMILSNKAILPMLWEMFPDSPYLLRADLNPLPGPHVRKPLLGREGANVQMIVDGQVSDQSSGIYGGPWVYQDLCLLPRFDTGQGDRAAYPVVGSWIVNGYACGIGIREDDSQITRDTARFVPHYFVE